jgi:hypothetical protein
MYKNMYVCIMYVRLYICMFMCMYVSTYICMYICTHLCGFGKMFKVVIQRKISHNYLVIMMFVIPKYSQHSNCFYTFQDVLFFL